MNFTRKKRRGMNQKTERAWFSEGHHYRITWRSEVFAVAVKPAYTACVLCVRSNENRDEMYWDFAGPRRPFKTMKAAVAACEHNEAIWNAFIALGREPGRRSSKLATLLEMSKVGNKPTVGVMLHALPKWVFKTADAGLLRMLFAPVKGVEEECDTNPSDPSDPLQASDNTAPKSSAEWEPSSSISSIPIQTHGRASVARVADESTSRPACTKSEGTTSNAPAVKEPGSAPEKSSSRPTGKSSKTTSRKSVGSKPSRKRVAKR